MTNDDNHGQWTLTFSGGSALWSNMRSALGSAVARMPGPEDEGSRECFNRLAAADAIYTPPLSEQRQERVAEAIFSILGAVEANTWSGLCEHHPAVANEFRVAARWAINTEREA